MAFDPGWYDDGHGFQRWWDGTGWTAITQPSPPKVTLPPAGWYDVDGHRRWWDGAAWSTPHTETHPNPAPVPGLDVIAFAPSKVKLALVLIIVAGFLVASPFFLASGPTPFEAFVIVVGIAFVLYFGIYTARRIARAKNYMVMTRDGLVTPVAGGVIPWADLEAVGTTRVSGAKVIGIRLSSYDAYVASLTPAEINLVMRTSGALKAFGIVATPFAGTDFDATLELAALPIQSKGMTAAFEYVRKRARGYDLTFSPLMFDRSPAKVVVAILGYRDAWRAQQEAEETA